MVGLMSGGLVPSEVLLGRSYVVTALSIKYFPDMATSGPDMEKGVDMRTLSAEIFENCGNFWIVEE